ncbi:MAG TPA: Rid family hydrolase [Burkholderiales bacterium]|nr:Rid family hydrolase [Burkholderiales bacterium]
MPTRKKSAVKPLLPVTIEQGGIRYAPGMKAGRWIFATGHKGNADFASGMSADVMREALPSWDSSKHRRESDQILANLGRVLQAGGSRFGNIVRVDQYYTDYRAVPPYHGARRAALGDHIPPSTSILMPRLLLAGQDIEMQMIAVEDGVKVQHIRPKAHAIHASSGYSLALTAGDFVFVAGRLADALVLTDGLAPEVRLPAGHLWKGVPVKLEAEYTIKQKLEPALKAAGSSLADIVKCQVYLRDPADFAPFNEVWREFLPKNPPATSVMPMATPGLAIEEGRIEINAIALRSGGKTRARTVDAKVMPAWGGYSQAVRAGDLLFISGLLAIDRNGLIDAARVDPAQPLFGSSVQAQMDHMLGNAQRLCEAAGTSLANVVRIQQFHADLKDFYPAYQVWEQHLPGQYLPYSAVEVPFLPVPGCTVQLDLWVYVP